MATATVTVEDFTPETVVLEAGDVILLCRWRAALSCGCAVWVGIRGDAPEEPATGFVPCSEGHEDTGGRFNDAMRLSLKNAGERPLIEVVSELLEVAR